MSQQESRECLRSLLVHRVPGSLDDHDATPMDRCGQAARRRGVAVVELAGDECGRNLDAAELVPDRSHRARAHAAERFRETRNVIVHSRRSHLGKERRAAAFQPLEQWQAAPVVDEGFEPVILKALGQRFVTSSPSFARFLIEAGVSADGEQRQDSFRPRRSNVEGKAAAHRVTDEMGARDPKTVPEPHKILRASLHRVWRAGLDTSRAMAAEVGQHPFPAGRHQRDDLVPAPAALGEAMEQCDRRTFADHLIVELDVISFENHK